MAPLICAWNVSVKKKKGKKKKKNILKKLTSTHVFMPEAAA